MKYADKSDCTQYYECTNGQLGDVQGCSFGSGSCNVYGPCVFDIFTKECVIPTDEFDCTLRCVETTTRQPIGLSFTTTHKVDNIVSDEIQEVFETSTHPKSTKLTSL